MVHHKFSQANLDVVRFLGESKSQQPCVMFLRYQLFGKNLKFHKPRIWRLTYFSTENQRESHMLQVLTVLLYHFWKKLVEFRGMFLRYKSLLGYKDQSVFLDTKVFFGYKKLFLTFSEVKGVSSIV